MRLSIFTLGCRVNQYESLAISDSAERAGFEVVGWGERADAAVVNSCSLTLLAEAKTRSAIRNFLRRNPDGVVAVCGCCAQTNPESLKKIPGVKWIIPNGKKLEAALEILRNPGGNFSNEKFSLPKNNDPASLFSHSPIDDRVNLKIQDGCDNACSYCIIPRARGLPRSRKVSDILSDARNLVSRGAREIVIAGINIAKFDGNLAKLIDSIAEIPKIKRIRLGSVEPFSEVKFSELAKRMADPSHPFAPHLHISAQSFSNAVLKAMRRKESSENFRRILDGIFEICPDAGIGTDVICGHPGEGISEFEETREALARWGFAYAHVFTFSPREKTFAASLSAPPAWEAKKRSSNLRILAKSLRKTFIENRLGKTLPALLEKRFPDGKYAAHTDNYIEASVSGVPDENAKNRLASVRISSEKNGIAECEFEKFLDSEI